MDPENQRITVVELHKTADIVRTTGRWRERGSTAELLPDHRDPSEEHSEGSLQNITRSGRLVGKNGETARNQSRKC